MPEEVSIELGKAYVEAMAKESVNKIAEAIGAAFPFWGLQKKAVNTYISEIQNSNLSPETKMLMIANVKQSYKKLKNQLAIAQIAQENADPNTDFSRNSFVDNEWLERFMDSARFVSDEKAQLLWGRVLAREFEHPNSTPPSVIRILTEVTPEYAKAFRFLCSLAVTFTPKDKDGRPSATETHIVLPDDYEYLNDYGITFAALNELQMLGLIQFDPSLGYCLDFSLDMYPEIDISYGDEKTTVIKYSDKQLNTGSVILTHAGEVISTFTEKTFIKGHFYAITKYLKGVGVEFDG